MRECEQIPLHLRAEPGPLNQDDLRRKNGRASSFELSPYGEVVKLFSIHMSERGKEELFRIRRMIIYHNSLNKNIS